MCRCYHTFEWAQSTGRVDKQYNEKKSEPRNLALWLVVVVVVVVVAGGGGVSSLTDEVELDMSTRLLAQTKALKLMSVIGCLGPPSLLVVTFVVGPELHGPT